VLQTGQIVQQHHNKIPPFRLRDNSVHLHECSHFLVGIFSNFLKRKRPCSLFYAETHSDLQGTESFLYVIGKSIIM